MSKLEKWSGGSVILALVATALLVLLFHTFVVVGLSEWWAKQDAPAWVQAIGSIAAIFAAIVISGNQYRGAQRLALEMESRRAWKRYNLLTAVVGFACVQISSVVDEMRPASEGQIAQRKFPLNGLMRAKVELTAINIDQLDSFYATAAIRILLDALESTLSFVRVMNGSGTVPEELLPHSDSVEKQLHEAMAELKLARDELTGDPQNVVRVF